jgi:hypothetical protein
MIISSAFFVRAWREQMRENHNNKAQVDPKATEPFLVGDFSYNQNDFWAVGKEIA